MSVVKQIKILFLGTVVLFFGVFSFLYFQTAIFAQSEDTGDTPEGAINIQYPVKELGGCKDENACKSYCDKPANMEICLNFAEKNNLMPKEEIEMARKFVSAGKKGPGGCATKESCENYCDDLKNMDECLAFAEKNGIMKPREFEDAKKVKALLEKGGKLPGGCKNKKECDNFCSTPDNMEECINFAEEAGFMPPEELAEAKKVLEVVKTKGIRPPPCRGKEDCDAYCGAPEHFEECITFAEAAGFVSEKEAQMARKTGGKGPGGCKGREECDSFCQKEENFETCLAFGVEHGLIPEKDLEMIRKTGGKGPGGCKGEKECRQFCDNPDNQETCFNFAKEHDMIPPEDLQRMEEGKQKMKEGMMNMPPEVAECLNSSLGSDFVNKLKEGAAMPSPKIGEQMRACFEKMGPPPGMPPRDGMMPPPEGMMEPGGVPQNMPPEVAECLKSELGGNLEEQMKSGALQPGQVDEKVKACMEKFGVPGQDIQRMPFEGMPKDGTMPYREGIMSPQNMNMPGLIPCKTPEECESICRQDPAKCPGFKPEGMLPPEAFLRPPEGQVIPDGTIPPEYQQQYEQQYQQQYQQQYDQQYQQQYQEYQQQIQPPPTELLPPPTSYNRPPTLAEFAANIIFGLLFR